MRHWCQSSLLSLLLLLFVTADAVNGVIPHGTHPSTDEVEPGIVIIKLKQRPAPAPGGLGKVSSALGAALARLGVVRSVPAFPDPPTLAKARSTEAAIGIDRIIIASLSPGLDPATVANAIARRPDVEYAEPKYLQRLHDIPNDPLYAIRQAAYFARMHAEEGWTVAKGNPAVVIAVVDGGTYWKHEDLRPSLWINPGEDINHNGLFDRGPTGDENGIDDDHDGYVDDVIGWNFSNNSDDPRGLPTTPIDAAHGTATASMCAAATNNTLGMAGSSWNCRLMPICASSVRDNSISYGYEGIRFAYSHGARVINCSWGRSGGYSRFEQDIVDAAARAGSLIVASAGNDGQNADLAPEYPANYRNVLAVGATNGGNDQRASFSNYGVTIPVFAPGVDILGANSIDSTGYLNAGSGTSYSAPLTSGLAGIVTGQHPAWTPAQVAAQIRVTSDDIDASNPALADSLGHGRINFLRALTERQPGIEVVDRLIATPGGRTIFLPGDTIVVAVTLTNLLAAATNIQVIAASADPALQPLDAAVNLPGLDSGQQVTLPPLRFRVGAVNNARRASIVLFWTAQGAAKDGTAFGIALFPSMPAWVLQSSPTDISLTSVKAVSPLVAWAVGSAADSTGGSTPVVVKTGNSGATWTDVTGNLTKTGLFCVDAVDSLHAWAGSGEGQIYATTNGGTSWFSQPYPGRQSSFIDALWFFDPNVGYALGDPPGGSDNRFVVLKTTDGGNTWTHLAGEPVGSTGEAGWNNSFWWVDTLHGWFGSNSAHVWRTTNGGQTWSAFITPAMNSVGVAFRDALSGIAVFDNGVATASTDGGATWILTPQPASVLLAVAYPLQSQTAWIASRDRTFRTSNNGAQWIGEYLYPTEGSLTHLSFADTTAGWAVTSSGEILHYGGVSGGNPPSPLPTSFALAQNYPNPFKGSTSITVAVAAPGNVSLTVFDLLGRRVRTLADGYLVEGEYTFQFDSKGLASGIYFYRFMTSNFSAVRKMIILH